MPELNSPVARPRMPLREWLGDTYRTHGANYLQVFSGTGVRLCLQVVYFFILANTLSLHDFGVFASTSATGVIIGTFSGFGFSSLVFRTAVGKRRSLGGYLGVFYGSWILSLPLCVIVSLPIYYLLFTSLSLTAFIFTILVETGTWRIVEMIHQVNNGLGRYSHASLVISIGTALRTAGAAAFLISSSHDVENWCAVYLASNLVAMALAIGLYQPQVRLRWRTRLFIAGIREALMFSVFNCALISQNEIDKVLILWLADQRTAGIYAISARLIDFTAMPLRTFYVLYSRKLILEGRKKGHLGRNLTVEALIALISCLAYAVLLAALSMWPNLLGHNVAAATQLFGVLLMVPAFKNLLEYHSELFFAYQATTVRTWLAVSLVILKTTGLAFLLICFSGLPEWGFSLNFVYAGLYALSALVVYRTLFRKASH